MQIILIGGKARSGKDTLGDYLIEQFEKQGKKPCKVQVGQYIKYYATKYFGWDGSEETKPRTLLQELGTDIIRNKIDPDFHINRLIEDLKVLSYFYDTFVISDVRFPNEIEKTKESFENVTTIKVERPSDELTTVQKTHATETGLDNYNNFDYIIKNDSTIEDLYKKGQNILTEIGD